MASCPNPECPFRKKFGRAAEYRAGFSSCSDCGGPLQEGGETAPAPKPAASSSSDWVPRAAVSLLAAGAAVAGSTLPLPGIDWPLPSERPTLSLLGLTPFLSAFVVVELAALLVPPWRALRVGGPAQRAKLRHAATVLGLVFLVVQSATLARALGASSGPGLFEDSVSTWSTPALTAVLVAGGLGLHLLARLVDWRGLGNGYSVVLLAWSAPAFVGFAGQLWQSVAMELLSPGGALAALAALVAFGVGVALLLRRRPGSSRTESPSSLAVPAAGLVPLSWAASALAMPATLSAWGLFGDEALRWLEADVWRYLAVELVLIVDFAVVLAILFHRPASVAQVWREYHPQLDAAKVGHRVRALLPSAVGFSLLLCGGAAALMPLLSTAFGLPLALSTAELVVAVAVGLDLWGELGFRRAHGPLASVGGLHRGYEVEPALERLRAAGVEAHPRGSFHRAVLQFFGPFVPVELLVPVSQVDAARAALARG